MPITSNRVAVTTTPVAVAGPAQSYNRPISILVKNSSSVRAFIGGPALTNGLTGNGMDLDPGQGVVLNMNEDDVLWGSVETGTGTISWVRVE